MALHILAFLDHFKQQRHTSQQIATSVGTNAVVARRILGQLKEAKLVVSHQGPEGGFSLSKDAQDIPLLDVYRAMNAAGENGVFATHEHPHPLCPVGGVIQNVLAKEFAEVQAAMEEALRNISLATISRDIQRANQKRGR